MNQKRLTDKKSRTRPQHGHMRPTQWRCRESNPGPHGRTRQASTCVGHLLKVPHATSANGRGRTQGKADWNPLPILQPEEKAGCSSSTMPRGAPMSGHSKRQMGRLRRHRIRIVVRSSVDSGLIYEKCQKNSTRNLLHDSIRRSRVIPNTKKNIYRVYTPSPGEICIKTSSP